MADFTMHLQEDETFSVDLQDAAGKNINTATELPLLNPTVAVTRFEDGGWVDKSSEFTPNGITLTDPGSGFNTEVTFNLNPPTNAGFYALLVEADTTSTGRHLVALGTDGLPPSLFVTDDAGV